MSVDSESFDDSDLEPESSKASSSSDSDDDETRSSSAPKKKTLRQLDRVVGFDSFSRPISDGKAALLRIIGSNTKEPRDSFKNLSVKRAALLPELLSIKGDEIACPALMKPFKLPRGVVSSEIDSELRARKTLGPRRAFGNVGVFRPLQSSPLSDFDIETDAAEQPKIVEEDFSHVEPLVLWEPLDDSDPECTPILVEPFLCKWLRPHQREGVRFLAECLTGQRDFVGFGSILADDMGLGKTLQSITLLYTFLRSGFRKNEPLAKRVMIICPTSLVANWANEIKKWCGERIRCIALSESSREKVIIGISDFLRNFQYPVLIISYETLRMHAERFTENCCDLWIADEAHRLKNSDTQTYTVLAKFPAQRRVLLSGTPMQNNLSEFFAMADLVNPNIFGDERKFAKLYVNPILTGREPDATEQQRALAIEKSMALSAIVNKFVLRRTNALLSDHLPPKVIQVVCCKLTPLQSSLYHHCLQSKAISSVLEEEKKPLTQVLPMITSLKKLCNHPRLVYEEAHGKAKKEKKFASFLEGVEDFFPSNFNRSSQYGVTPEMSGKMTVLDNLLQFVRKTTDDRCVLISNYTQTLDLFTALCRARSWPCLRLDGSTSVKKRQKLVDQLCDRKEDNFIFLLSSKAGGCGLNLIGANRLVLFDPDWNPAVDKQAAARIWRDGQKKKCFIYRFLAVGTIEEKVYQRQLSKEGLQNVIGSGAIDETAASMEDLRDLFSLREDTLSDIHDTLDCDCISCEQKQSEPSKIQIGVPKEEDLASWAHHTSLASVPDEVFRDSHAHIPSEEQMVSFVFSCEVAGCAVVSASLPPSSSARPAVRLTGRTAVAPVKSSFKSPSKVAQAPAAVCLQPTNIPVREERRLLTSFDVEIPANDAHVDSTPPSSSISPSKSSSSQSSLLPCPDAPSTSKRAFSKSSPSSLMSAPLSSQPKTSRLSLSKRAKSGESPSPHKRSALNDVTNQADTIVLE